MNRGRRYWAGAVALGLVTLAPHPPSAAAEVSCTEAFRAAQLAERARQLVAASENFGTCARATCREELAQRCAERKRLVDARVPTIRVVTAVRGQASEAAARIWVDGVERTGVTEGTALALDPGKHTIGALEPKSGLQKTVEIELFEGEKNRRVVLEFDAPKPSSQPSTWLSAPASASGQPLVREVPWPAAPQSRAGIAWPTYLFGGLAVASFATAIAFGVRGVSQEEERLLPCKPRCLPSEVDAVQANYIVADVALGLGIVSTGLAAYFLISSLTRTTPKKSEAALVPLPMPGGGVGLLTGRF